jgi:hypothetical protein
MPKLLKTQKKSKKSPPKNTKTVFEIVKQLLDERDAKGRATYGGSLYPFNGRSSIQDALEEALDLTVYLTQLAIEQKIIKP